MENNQKPILITGANGFVGKNLVAQLRNSGYSNLMLFDVDTPKEKLNEFALKAEFVFHLAGVNRPKDPSEFYEGNRGLTSQLLHLLSHNKNNAPVLITSSTQAALDNDYGKSKREAEELVFEHEQTTGAPVYIYRLPGVFGKWCRPAYNSVVATFCHNVANNLPIEVRDEAYSFPIVYIDDVVQNFINALNGTATRSNTTPSFCELNCDIYTVSLGELAFLINSFKESRGTLDVPNMGDSFTKKLYATYLSYLPTNEFSYPLTQHNDDRGSFTEFLHTPNHGQVSINISKPKIVKGNHWHNTKNEKFLVVKGTGVIRFRKLNTTEIFEYNVSGEKLEVVDIPTGYTHNIENTGSEDMVTVMWANEIFDPQNPDTFFEKV